MVHYGELFYETFEHLPTSDSLSFSQIFLNCDPYVTPYPQLVTERLLFARFSSFFSMKELNARKNA